MNKQTGLTLVFLGMLAVCLVPSEFAVANFTPLPTLPAPVYIRADGSVDPTSASIQQTGDTYTLTGNINNTVEIQRSNITLDGNGFTVTKPDVNTDDLMMPIGWLPGVHISGVSNITVKNTVFENCISGVTIENASHVIVSNATFRETLSDIVIGSASYVTIIGSKFTLKEQSFATAIQLLPKPNHITIEGNQIIGTSTDVPSVPLQPSQYGIWGGCAESKIVRNNFTNIKGLALYYSGSNSVIAGNNFVHNQRGLFISSQSASNNTIFGNNFDHNSENAIVPFIRDVPVNFWDNGTVGNYWSNYTGIDMNGDGLGDTPHIIEMTYYNYTQEKEITLQQGQDNYPVMAPLKLSNGTFALPSASSTPMPTEPALTPESSPLIPELSTAATLGIVIGGLIVAVSLKKRRQTGKRY